jgi:polyphenol oxidase
MQIIFDKNPQIMAGLSERSEGSMIWWNRLPVDETVRKNRDRYFEKIKINPQRVVAGGIAYGTNVALVTEAEAGKYLLNADALITNNHDIFLSVTAADCLPVYFYDPATKSCGIAHASWHGLLGGILENVVKKFQDSFNSSPENIQAIIGPHIKSCHYEVGLEVAVKFAPQNIEERGGRLFADLGAEAVKRLRNSGVSDIVNSQECTYDNPEKFYSARRDKCSPSQGMAAYIGIKKYDYLSRF